MSDVSLSTFPRTRIDSLTMLYLEHQNLQDVTPEQLAEMYAETYAKISKAFTASTKVKTFNL